MGQASSTSAPTLLESELGSECVYDSSLGQSRFVRTIKAVHGRTGNLLVVRVYAKADPSISLKGYAKRLRAERDALADASNVLAYQTVLETEKAGYLIRCGRRREIESDRQAIRRHVALRPHQHAALPRAGREEVDRVPAAHGVERCPRARGAPTSERRD